MSILADRLITGWEEVPVARIVEIGLEANGRSIAIAETMRKCFCERVAAGTLS
jgi:hypothetical protein